MNELDFSQLSQVPQAGYPGGVSNKLAFFAASLSNKENPIQEFQRTKYNLETTGNDPLTSDLMQQYNTEYSAIQSNMIQQVALDPTISDDQKVVEAQAISKNKPLVKLEKEYMLEEADKANLPFGNIDEVMTAQDTVLDTIRQRQSEISKAREARGWGTGIADFAGGMIPFANNELYVTLAEKMFPEEDTSMFASPGYLGRAIRRKFLQLTPEEKPAFINTLLQTIREDAGYFDNSLLIEEQAISDTLGPLLDGRANPEDWTGWEALNDGIYLLDAIGFGQMLKGGLSLSGKLVQSAVGATAKADPVKAATVLKTAAQSDELARGLNLTQADITESALPGIDPKGILDMDIEVSIGDEILESSAKTAFIYTDDEIATATTKIREARSTTNNVRFSSNGTTITHTSRDAAIQKSVYLNSESKPFTSAKEAREVAEKNFEGNVTIKRWTRNDEVLGDVTDGKGYHVIQTEDKVGIDFSYMKDDPLSFNDNNWFGFLTSGFVHASPSARLSKEFVGKAFEAARKGSKFSEKFGKMFETFTKLKGRMKADG